MKNVLEGTSLRKAFTAGFTAMSLLNSDPAHLDFWTIYEGTKDYPKHFVVRRWRTQGGRLHAQECQLFDTLAEARASLPRGLHNLGRYPEDDPVIVETWV